MEETIQFNHSVQYLHFSAFSLKMLVDSHSVHGKLNANSFFCGRETASGG